MKKWRKQEGSAGKLREQQSRTSIEVEQLALSRLVPQPP
jgi:ribosomal protein L32E